MATTNDPTPTQPAKGSPATKQPAPTPPPAGTQPHPAAANIPNTPEAQRAAAAKGSGAASLAAAAGEPTIDSVMAVLRAPDAPKAEQTILRALSELAQSICAGLTVKSDREAVLRKVVASKDAFTGALGQR